MQVVRVPEWLITERDQHITRLEPCGCGWAARLDRGEEEADTRAKPPLLVTRNHDRNRGDAEPWGRSRGPGEEGRDEVGRHRQRDAWRGDHRVYADDPPVRVGEWTAGVPWPKGEIGPDQLARLAGFGERAHDSERERIAQAEGVTDCQDQLSRPKPGSVTEGSGGKVIPIDLDRSEIVFLIAPHDPPTGAVAVRE